MSIIYNHSSLVSGKKIMIIRNRTTMMLKAPTLQFSLFRDLTQNEGLI